MQKFILGTCFVALTACSGGDGGDTASKPDKKPPAQVDITEANFDNVTLGTVSAVEAPLDLSSLLESELYWIVNQYDTIRQRDCAYGGKVSWQFSSKQADSGSAVLDFEQCAYRGDEPYSVVFDGQVQLSYEIAEVNPALTAKVNEQKAAMLSTSDIDQVRINATADNFSFREYNGLRQAFVSFEFSSWVDQTWLLDRPEQIDTKVRRIDVAYIDANIANNITFTLTNAVVEQGPTTASDGTPKTKTQMSGSYYDAFADVSGTLTASITTLLDMSTTYRYSTDAQMTGNVTLNSESGQTLTTRVYPAVAEILLDNAPVASADIDDLLSYQLFVASSNARMVKDTSDDTHRDAVSDLGDISAQLAEGKTITWTFNHGVEQQGSISRYQLQDFIVVKDKNQLQLTPLFNVSPGLYQWSFDYPNEPGVPDTRYSVIGIAGEVTHYDHKIDELVAYRDGTVTRLYQRYTNSAQLSLLEPNSLEIQRTSKIPINDLQYCPFAERNSVYILGQNNDKNQLLEYDLTSLKLLAIHNLGAQYETVRCQADSIVLIADREVTHPDLHYGIFNVVDNQHSGTMVIDNILNDYRVLSYVVDRNTPNVLFVYTYASMSTREVLAVRATGEGSSIEPLPATVTNQWREDDLFINERLGHLYWHSVVYDMATEQVIHDFSNSANSDEVIVFVDERLQVVVTNYAVYDAQSFVKQHELPSLFAPQWIVTADNQLVSRAGWQALYVLPLTNQTSQ
ncbi:hypothetical protein QWY77_08050 [Thalassotalea ponticola]|uniref:hypothetical protein n=1 Tax=Thalassotalea ponticola TaxID=1523392 RepID=UPI0025B325A8|nr:hypothetical protein [Thalassotalea ponticola]MDN3652715.1 hypothetical protein [Thalassotalea ponticola]